MLTIKIKKKRKRKPFIPVMANRPECNHRGVERKKKCFVGIQISQLSLARLRSKSKVIGS